MGWHQSRGNRGNLGKQQRIGQATSGGRQDVSSTAVRHAVHICLLKLAPACAESERQATTGDSKRAGIKAGEFGEAAAHWAGHERGQAECILHSFHCILHNSHHCWWQDRQCLCECLLLILHCHLSARPTRLYPAQPPQSAMLCGLIASCMLCDGKYALRPEHRRAAALQNRRSSRPLTLAEVCCARNCTRALHMNMLWHEAASSKTTTEGGTSKLAGMSRMGVWNAAAEFTFSSCSLMIADPFHWKP